MGQASFQVVSPATGYSSHDGGFEDNNLIFCRLWKAKKIGHDVVGYCKRKLQKSDRRVHMRSVKMSEINNGTKNHYLCFIVLLPFLEKPT